jgi:hypothetical protein
VCSRCWRPGFGSRRGKAPTCPPSRCPDRLLGSPGLLPCAVPVVWGTLYCPSKECGFLVPLQHAHISMRGGCLNRRSSSSLVSVGLRTERVTAFVHLPRDGCACACSKFFCGEVDAPSPTTQTHTESKIHKSITLGCEDLSFVSPPTQRSLCKLLLSSTFIWNDSVKQKSRSVRNLRKITFQMWLLPYSPHSLLYRPRSKNINIKILRFCMGEENCLSRCSGAWEQSRVEECVFVPLRGSNRRLGKTAKRGGSWFALFAKSYCGDLVMRWAWFVSRMWDTHTDLWPQSLKGMNGSLGGGRVCGLVYLKVGV